MNIIVTLEYRLGDNHPANLCTRYLLLLTVWAVSSFVST